jgi:hypothetical protein
MAKVTFNAAQVPANPVYNWSPVDATVGMLDIGYVSTDAPGPGPSSTGLQNVATSVLPKAIFEPQLGQIIRAWEPTLGFGEFIYLAVPTSTAVPLGTLVSWDFGAAGPYQVVAAPAGGTSLNSGAPLAICVSSTVQTNSSPPSPYTSSSNIGSGLGISSNSSSIQYAWFQIGGTAQVLKTAVQVAPVTTEQGAGVYLSGTAGRIYLTASSGKQILGARLGNQSTVTSTSSCVLVYLNGRPVVEGK